MLGGFQELAFDFVADNPGLTLCGSWITPSVFIATS
jgi:hypothetical protein